jgi:phage baseplate assembly protein W
MAELAYLGKAEKFPLQPDVNAGIALIDSTSLIEQSMKDILSTPKGTRIYLENYGSYLHLLRFQPNDAILESLGVSFIAEALFEWEKRIRVQNIGGENVKITQMNFRVIYRILASNEIKSFIYPFYREITT